VRVVGEKHHIGAGQGAAWQDGSELLMQLISSERGMHEYVDMRIHDSAKRAFVMDPDFLTYVLEFSDRGSPSIGMHAVLLASNLCRDVKLYGFFQGLERECSVPLL